MSVERDCGDDDASGPFCRHWSDPADCVMACARCGHLCCEHDVSSPGECLEAGCTCERWSEA